MNDRKYRHRGYQESDSESRSRGPSVRPPPREGPRGRGADQAKALVFACKACGEKHRDLEEVGLETQCRRCGADLHACAQCSHFDTSARFECAKPIPARIPNKKLRNDCPLFSPSRSFDLTGSRAEATPDHARSAFDALFKK